MTTIKGSSVALKPMIVPQVVGDLLDGCNAAAVDLLLEYAQKNYHDLDALSAERANFLGAVTWADQNRRWLSLIDYALVLDDFLDTQGYWEEDKHNLELALRASENLGPGYENRRALLLHNLAVIHMAQGDYQRAEAYFDHSLKLQYRLGDRLAISRVLHYLGRISARSQDYKKAHQFFEQSLALGQEVDDTRGVGATLHEIGTLHMDQGAFGLAEDYYQRSLAISRNVSNLRDTADTLHQLGILYYRQREFDQAQSYFEEALHLRYKVFHREGIARSLFVLGQLAHDSGDLNRAKRLWNESLDLFEYLGVREADSVRVRLSTLGSP
ncbi:hypothetical protein ANRL4_02964 [Anaerolineae bacterium]|nr:hypothetical protein ANRL4_02964 [Anaerolineae bacterium]